MRVISVIVVLFSLWLQAEQKLDSHYKLKWVQKEDKKLIQIHEPPTPLDDMKVRKQGYLLCEVPDGSGTWEIAKTEKKCKAMQEKK